MRANVDDDQIERYDRARHVIVMTTALALLRHFHPLLWTLETDDSSPAEVMQMPVMLRDTAKNEEPTDKIEEKCSVYSCSRYRLWTSAVIKLPRQIRQKP